MSKRAGDAAEAKKIKNPKKPKKTQKRLLVRNQEYLRWLHSIQDSDSESETEVDNTSADIPPGLQAELECPLACLQGYFDAFTYNLTNNLKRSFDSLGEDLATRVDAMHPMLVRDPMRARLGGENSVTMQDLVREEALLGIEEHNKAAQEDVLRAINERLPGMIMEQIKAAAVAHEEAAAKQKHKTVQDEVLKSIEKRLPRMIKEHLRLPVRQRTMKCFAKSTFESIKWESR
ncbi:hypothetical protein B0H63DRAFT_446586 [Podospora didyma]|uniref:Uncharacterized protein n=1 Tax=Podospora didyma TaxID=330526 RepID=A0AAE0NZG6_9PEZI|nr:hypothetical protein B0H63DRAFT_446586 [Podospora didyma]